VSGVSLSVCVFSYIHTFGERTHQINRPIPALYIVAERLCTSPGASPTEGTHKPFRGMAPVSIPSYLSDHEGYRSHWNVPFVIVIVVTCQGDRDNHVSDTGRLCCLHKVPVWPLSCWRRLLSFSIFTYNREESR